MSKIENKVVSDNGFMVRSEAKVESDDRLGLVFRQSAWKIEVKRMTEASEMRMKYGKPAVENTVGVLKIGNRKCG